MPAGLKSGYISTEPWRKEEVWMLINVLKGDDERKCRGYPFSGLSWPPFLLKWSVRPRPIMFSLIIISRYSACLSERGCYQRTTYSEDERGIKHANPRVLYVFPRVASLVSTKIFHLCIHDSWLLFWSMRENLGDQPESNHCCLWYNLKRLHEWNTKMDGYQKKKLFFGLAAYAVKVWVVGMILLSCGKCRNYTSKTQRASFIHWQPFKIKQCGCFAELLIIY